MCSKEKIVLRYGNVGCEGPNGEVQRSDALKFVALDGASGGYPYAVYFDRAEDFITIDNVNEYIKHFKGLTPYAMKMSYDLTPIH